LLKGVFELTVLSVNDTFPGGSDTRKPLVVKGLNVTGNKFTEMSPVKRYTSNYFGLTFRKDLLDNYVHLLSELLSQLMVWQLIDLSKLPFIMDWTDKGVTVPCIDKHCTFI
jgi:hypothetical protein